MPFEHDEILLPLHDNDGTPVEPEKFQKRVEHWWHDVALLRWRPRRSQGYGSQVGVRSSTVSPGSLELSFM